MTPVADEKLRQLREGGTAVIADVCDALGERPRVLDTALRPIKGVGHGFAGPAYTVVGESHDWSGGGDRAKLAAIDAMPAGVVPIWAGGDIEGVCCFGDLLGGAMQARGCRGVVVDGGVRDVTYLRETSLPVVARYVTPAQAIGRWRVTARQVSIAVRGAIDEWVTVDPDDVIVADDDGVIVVPQGLVERVLRLVVAWSNSESDARREILGGMPLLTALDKYGHL